MPLLVHEFVDVHPEKKGVHVEREPILEVVVLEKARGQYLFACIEVDVDVVAVVGYAVGYVAGVLREYAPSVEEMHVTAV